MEEDNLNIQSLLALTCAHIDQHLLQDETGEDKSVTFTAEEVRQQLSNTLDELQDALALLGLDIEEPFKSSNSNIIKTSHLYNNNINSVN